MQGVNSSLYVYQEVLEGCNELVTAEEYTSLGQVCFPRAICCHSFTLCCEQSS